MEVAAYLTKDDPRHAFVDDIEGELAHHLILYSRDLVVANSLRKQDEVATVLREEVNSKGLLFLIDVLSSD